MKSRGNESETQSTFGGVGEANLKPGSAGS